MKTAPLTVPAAPIAIHAARAPATSQLTTSFGARQSVDFVPSDTASPAAFSTSPKIRAVQFGTSAGGTFDVLGLDVRRPPYVDPGDFVTFPGGDVCLVQLASAEAATEFTRHLRHTAATRKTAHQADGVPAWRIATERWLAVNVEGTPADSALLVVTDLADAAFATWARMAATYVRQGGVPASGCII